MKLFYLGPEGTFTHQAAMTAADQFATLGDFDLIALPDVPAIMQAVQSRQGWGVIAWENNVEGYVVPNLDALIDSDMPVVVVATHDAMYEKVRSNVQEIKAREGRVIAFVSKGEQDITRMADATIELPDTLECLEPLMATVPLQLLAYYIAVCKGKDVDQPRNLAKSVTVE